MRAWKIIKKPLNSEMITLFQCLEKNMLRSIRCPDNGCLNCYISTGKSKCPLVWIEERSKLGLEDNGTPYEDCVFKDGCYYCEKKEELHITDPLRIAINLIEADRAYTEAGFDNFEDRSVPMRWAIAKLKDIEYTI